MLRGLTNRSEAQLDVFLRGRPRRHTDSHRHTTLPFCAAAPADAILLETRDHGSRRLRSAERDEYLIDDDVVQHGKAGSAQTVRESARVIAGPFDDVRQAFAAQGTECGPE